MPAMTDDTSAAPPLGAKPPGSNLPDYTVSELSAALKKTVEDSYGHVRVRGEISRPKTPSSGHLYLTLKDDRAVLDAVCWRGTVSRLEVRPEEGLEVICTGRLTTYPGQSKYQLIIERMELAGEGALLKMLEERRRRLAAEGLFDEARKKPLPVLPAVIGVVTSPTGAVIRDILHRLADRFPRPVLVWPVAVQGAGAAEQIAAAIAGFDALPPDGPVPRPDLLIVARGGGSLEDLWAFNEEVVVRAAAACTIPLISAIGHETDTTLIDFAADRRAPTPTAAAEMAVPVRTELLTRLRENDQRLLGAAGRLVQQRRLHVEGLGRGLGDPLRLLEGAMQRLDDRGDRLGRALPVLLDRRRARLAEAAARLRHPRQVLAEAGERIARLGDRLTAAGNNLLAWERRRFAPLADRLTPDPLLRALDLRRRRLDDVSARHARTGAVRLAAAEDRLTAAAKLLESYSYRNVLSRGFVVVRDDSGTPVTSGAALKPGQPIALEFHDRDRIDALIAGARPAPRATAEPAPKPRQERLL